MVTGHHGRLERYINNVAKHADGTTEASVRAGPVVTRKLNWGDLSLSELQEMRAMWWAGRGGSQQLLWMERCLQSESGTTSSSSNLSSQECVYGRLQGAFEWVQPEPNRYEPASGGLAIVSMGRQVGR